MPVRPAGSYVKEKEGEDPRLVERTKPAPAPGKPGPAEAPIPDAAAQPTKGKKG